MRKYTIKEAIEEMKNTVQVFSDGSTARSTTPTPTATRPAKTSIATRNTMNGVTL